MTYFWPLIFYCGLILQAGYCLFFFSRVLSNRNKDHEPSSDEATGEPVSVIIAARNEYNNLKELIPELCLQEYGNFEIIIANDRSEDGTGTLLDQLAESHTCITPVHISSVPAGWDPKKYALSMAIEAAQHDILLLTDADCRPRTRNWIDSMTRPFRQDPDLCMVTGYSGYRHQSGLLPFLIRYETIQTALQYAGYLEAGIPYMAVGRNLAYRKRCFNHSNGYKDIASYTGGDDDLLLNKFAKNGQSITSVMDAEAQTTTYPPTTLSGWFQQKKRHLAAGRKYRPAAQAVSGGWFLSYGLLYGGLAGILICFGGTNGIIGGIILRTVLLITIFAGGLQRFKEKFPLYWVPIIDILYFIYLVILGITGYLSKKIRWATT